MEVLKKKLSVSSQTKPWNKYFDDLAKALMSKYVIKKGNVIYEFAEIEFYLFHNGQNEHIDTSVYPRECKAGTLFYHYSGVDIAFETCINESNVTFGGILIRSLVKKNDPKTDGEIIAGPLRCKDELLNGEGPIEITALQTPIDIDSELWKCRRQGVSRGGKQEKLYRYYRNRDKGDWDRKPERMLYIKKDEKITVVKTPKTETYSGAPNESHMPELVQPPKD